VTLLTDKRHIHDKKLSTGVLKTLLHTNCLPTTTAHIVTGAWPRGKHLLCSMSQPFQEIPY